MSVFAEEESEKWTSGSAVGKDAIEHTASSLGVAFSVPSPVLPTISAEVKSTARAGFN